MSRYAKYGIRGIVSSSLWIYISSLLDNFQGFIYWMLMSTLVGPTSLGIASAITSIASLTMGLLNLGIDTGVRRFFGISLSHDNKDMLIRYFWSSYVFMGSLYIATGLSMMFLGLRGFEVGGISGIMLIFTSLTILGGLGGIPSALITSMLKTEVIFFSVVLSIIARFLIGLTLTIVFNLGWVGAVAGNIAQLYVRMLIILTYSLREVGRELKVSLKALKDVLLAGIASWLPGVIASIGSSLGILSTYVISGASETGYYYITFTMCNVVIAVANSMISISFPVLSGISDGRKRLTFQLIKLGLAIVTPVAIYLMIYSWLPLSFFGRGYVEASNLLTVMMISTFPSIIASGISTLVYAYGNYGLVLFIGLASNLARVILYCILVPIYGGLGSSISYTIGSFIAFITSLYVASKIGLRLDWGLIAKVIIPPAILGCICMVTNLHWLISLLAMSSTYVMYLRLKVVSKSELRELVKAVNLEALVKRIYGKYGDLIDRVLGIS